MNEFNERLDEMWELDDLYDLNDLGDLGDFVGGSNPSEGWRVDWAQERPLDKINRKLNEAERSIGEAEKIASDAGDGVGASRIAKQRENTRRLKETFDPKNY